MSSIFDERDAYKRIPGYKPEYSDFSPFYIAITFCTVIGVLLFVLNIAFGCCSRYSRYWNERHTGNHWIVTFWTSTPHNQPPIDLSELKDVHIPHSQVVYEARHIEPEVEQPVQYLELKKRESEI